MPLWHPCKTSSQIDPERKEVTERQKKLRADLEFKDRFEMMGKAGMRKSIEVKSRKGFMQISEEDEDMKQLATERRV